MYTKKTKVIKHDDFEKRQSDIEIAHNELSDKGCMIIETTTYNDYETVITYGEPTKPEYEFIIEAIERIEAKVILEKGEKLYIKRI